MKKIFLALIILVSALSAHAQSKFFESCEDMDGVTTVYISKAMLQFAGAADIDAGDIDISPLVSKLDGIEIISAEGSNAAKISRKAKEFVKGDNVESLMRVKDDGETVNMFLRKFPKGRNEFILLVDENKEFTVILFSGTMTMDEVMKAVKK